MGSGVANLFTREFFTLGRERLHDDGVFAQWLQIYQLSTESMRSVLATFSAVYPHVAVFRIQGAAKGKDLILLGSRVPIDLDRIDERMKDPRTSADLSRVGLRTAADVRAWFVGDERQIGPAVAGAIINTDDNMYVETGCAARGISRNHGRECGLAPRLSRNKCIADCPVCECLAILKVKQTRQSAYVLVLRKDIGRSIGIFLPNLFHILG